MAVVAADGVPWEVPVLVATLRDRRPGMKLIGLFKTRPVPCDGLTLLPRTAAPEQVFQLAQPGSYQAVPFLLMATANSERGPLTVQRLRVIALLSPGGLTAPEVAARLGSSERGVAKSKAAIYAKWGAQSQAQAVASALAARLLGAPTGSQSS
jgi:DNA-binding CsgD family transcriptional regulator